MGDLTEYLTLKYRIKELEEINKKLIIKFKNARRLKNKYKKKYMDIIGKTKGKTRSQKALKMITKVDKMTRKKDVIENIAKKCFLSVGTVYNLWYKHY